MMTKRGRHRALALLAEAPDGVTEAIMVAHGFAIPDMVELVRAGLASARAQRMRVGSKMVEVGTLRITANGRAVLLDTSPTPRKAKAVKVVAPSRRQSSRR
jgi:hypothetical protein